jgi:hypothetical protein
VTWAGHLIFVWARAERIWFQTKPMEFDRQFRELGQRQDNEYPGQQPQKCQNRIHFPLRENASGQDQSVFKFGQSRARY